MRAMVLATQAPIERHPLRACDVPPPVPADDEVLVRVAACGLCRTDLHVIEGDLPPRLLPIVPGHQVIGHVQAAGARARRFGPGDRVGIAWLRRSCGACAYCRRGRENLCERPEFTGYTAPGGFAELATVPEAFAYPIPDVFGDAEAAPLLCAGIIGYRALRLAELPPHGRLGLYGFGSSAHITLQVARAAGAEVYVCTREATHRELARRLGAAWAGDIPDAMPHPADSIIVFAPAGELVPIALHNLAPGGTLSLAGIYMTDIPALPYAELYRERTVRSVTANTRQDGAELLAAAAAVPVRPAVTTFPLDQANVALERLKHGEIAGSAVLLLPAASSGV